MNSKGIFQIMKMRKFNKRNCLLNKISLTSFQYNKQNKMNYKCNKPIQNKINSNNFLKKTIYNKKYSKIKYKI